MADPNSVAQSGQITLEIPGLSLRIDKFKCYRFDDHFLQPSDSWSFTIGDEAITQNIITRVSPGQKVSLTIDGHVTSTGYVDSVSVRSDRNGGTEVTVCGRDWLSPAVDSCVDPYNTKFNAGQTVFDVVTAAFAPFGVSVFASDNDTNKNVITGQVRGKPTSKKGKPLKAFTLHQLRPYDREGAFQFASRITERFGLWIWPSADGTYVIVGQPDFDQEPRYNVLHKINAAGANNNVISGDVTRDAMEQPSCIVAVADSTGGEFDRAKLKVIVINELVATNDDGSLRSDVSAILAKHKDAKVIPLRADFAAGIPFQSIQAKPQFIRDGESKTSEQLQHFALREMAKCQHRAVVARYTLEGHMAAGQPWAVDTIVNVDDDYANIHGPMWVLARTFTKSRSEGTRTEIECILPKTIVL